MKKIASRKDNRVVDLLIAHGAAGYGIYVMLVEYLGQRKSMHSRSDLARIAYELHADTETVRSVLEDFALFDCTESEYYNLGKTPKPKHEAKTEVKPEPEIQPEPEEGTPVSVAETAPEADVPESVEKPKIDRWKRRRILKNFRKEQEKKRAAINGCAV